MSADLIIGIVIILVMLALILFSGMSPGLAMLASGTAGFLLLRPPDTVQALLNAPPGAELWGTFGSYGFTVIPLFVLMGEILYQAGYSQRLFAAAEAWLSNVRGGLAITTIFASAGFSAICGSNTATAATMCSVALEPMDKAGYHPELKCGSIAAGSTLGAMIPPSIVLVIYGLCTGQSIGKLFAGTLIPGVILTLLFVATIVILCRRNPDWTRPGRPAAWSERWRTLPPMLEIALLFALVMGGLFSGLVTPTESAGYGALLALILGLVRRRLTLAKIRQAGISTLRISGMVYLILAGATVFGKFLVATRLPQDLTVLVRELPLPPVGILLMMLSCYIIGGCLMDALAFQMLSLPLFLPLLKQMNIDLIWFGQVVCVATTLGAITPPIGISSFVVAARSGNNTWQVFKGGFYFLPAYGICLLFLFVFPEQMVGWLANLVK